MNPNESQTSFDNASDVLPQDLFASITRYERALMANDKSMLSELFANDPDNIPAIRSDCNGTLAGHAAITTFRTHRISAPTRTLRQRIA